MNPWEIRQEVPPIEGYLHLRKVAGLSEKEWAAAEIGLANSLFAVCAYTEGDKLIGMARIVGDGGLNFEVVDVAVDPNYQRRGIASALMTEVINYLDTHAPKSAYVSLIGDLPGQRLYQKFGFRDTAPSIGMAKRY
ncbi:Acetyltransferase (GNAT) domain-containing protein [Marininema mesophilum]|uniref:Acetyltransferase (GNAT) domain-containing protein n=1 Tax=Marininema mesophilum TaxID=1048340 RepID=A0A1H2TNF0_9BACL|nr:GNAT family N-acetyltransferase [Marininema mesophilum]SDW45401.1 Acetyltransferase (GNAT) domain-containing protein [Marininema mesophilum]